MLCWAWIEGLGEREDNRWLQKSLNKCLTCLAEDDKSPQREYSAFQTSSLGSVARLGKKFIILLRVCGVFSVNNNNNVHFMHLNHSLKLRAKRTEPKVKVTKLIWLHGWGAGRFRRGRSTTLHSPTKGLRGESNYHVCSGERGKGEVGIKISRLLDRQEGTARG